MSSAHDRFQRRLGFPLKITLTITLILGFGVGINLFLNYINFSNSYRQLVQSQFAVISTDLKHTIESGLNLGLDLGELRSIQELLSEVQKTHPQLTMVTVADSDGTILFDLEAARIGQSLPDSWPAAAVSEGTGGHWQREDGALFVQGSPLFNSFQQRSGTLVIAFPATLVNDVSRQVFHSFLWDFILIVSGAFLLTALLVRLNAQGLLHSLRRMSASLSAVETGEPASLGATDAGNALEQDFAGFQTTLVQVQHQLDALHLALASDLPQAHGGKGCLADAPAGTEAAP